MHCKTCVKPRAQHRSLVEICLCEKSEVSHGIGCNIYPKIKRASCVHKKAAPAAPANHPNS